MDADHEITTRDQVTAALEGAWSALQEVVSSASASDLMERTDVAGWSPGNHLAHLAAWANSVLVMIRDGRPQWEGLGIDEALYNTEGYDEKNEAIRQQTVGWSLDRVTSHLAEVHHELMRVLAGMSDADLRRPCSAFVAGGQEFEIFHKLQGNGPEHYDEHRVYIERILAG